MSPETQPIPVPTNGKKPHPGPVADAPADPPPVDDSQAISFTPAQLAVGFGIVASLILLVVSRIRRGRNRRGRWPIA